MDVFDGVVANAVFGLDEVVIAGDAENGEFVAVDLAGGAVDEFTDSAGSRFAFGGFGVVSNKREESQSGCGQGRKAEEFAAG